MSDQETPLTTPPEFAAAPSRAARFTRAALSAIHRAPYLTLLASLALTALVGLAARDLQLKTKIQDLLPAHAPSLQASEELGGGTPPRVGMPLEEAGHAGLSQPGGRFGGGIPSEERQGDLPVQAGEQGQRPRPVRP